ncbi:MAG: glycosyltransferase, partial [Candidatus Deferrimicrobiaceae bacterium]
MGPWKYPVGVAYVMPNFEQGGTEKHVLELAAGLDRRKFAPIAVATSAGGSLEESFRTRGVPVHILPFPGIPLGPHPVRTARSIRRAAGYFSAFSGILREGRVAIVHSYLPVSNILGTAAGWIGRVPVRIVSKRGLCRYKVGHPVQTVLEDLANLLADAVLVNSSAVAEEVRRHERFLGGKIRRIYNGIGATSASPEPIGRLFPELAGQDDGPVVVCVANLFPYKGHRDLVTAARIVADGLPGVRFLLVGRDAGEEEKVRALIGSLGLDRHVFLTGPRTDVPRILSSVE